MNGRVRRGEIYWLDWSPGRGSEQGGVRPAVVVQNDVGNQHSPTTIVAAVTTQSRPTYPFQVGITAQESGLPGASTVLLNQIQTIDKARLGENIGRLGAPRMAQIDEALRVSLGLRLP